jgi:glutaconate CoA-transferase subunit B
VENTGFPLKVAGQIPVTPLPTAEELRLLREEIDPRRVYLR